MVLLDVLLVTLTVLLFLLTCTMIAHVWVRVPYVPTEARVVEAMVDSARLLPGQVVYDLGAGDGRTLIAALRKCSAIRAIAIESVYTVYLWGRLKTLLSGEKVQWKFGSFLKRNVSDADAIFLYLCPSLMAKLEQKFTAELRRGTRVVSHAFVFPNRQPLTVIEVPCKRRVRKVYVYEW
ncbi:MAG: hypothetical protein PHU04_03560 [Candidatus Peribacteraceae bacterium]|nr:hypothetical protein [Candidatus Peribacteraceae bacterium]